MGYEIIDAESFFKEKQGQTLKIREMKKVKRETILTPAYELTLEELIQQINIFRKESKPGTFELEVKSMVERYSVEVVYYDKNKGFIHINIWTIEK